MKSVRYSSKIGLLLMLFFLKAGFIKAQVSVEKDHYQLDNNLRIILCNLIPESTGAEMASINLGKTYFFSKPVHKIQTGLAYNVSCNDTTYTLYFTRLPILNLKTSTTINSNETGGLITITDTLGSSYNSNMGIRIRGSYSSTLPKKSYHVQLWTDSTGNTTTDESLLGFRTDKTWLLLAMYNEKLRLNNKVSDDLWRKIHTLYYADLEPDAHASIRTRYVDVFLNNAYQGVYLFAEDMDRKELKLKKQTTAGTGGELYKGEGWDAGTMFTGVPDLPSGNTITWGGWELSYPDADQTDWKKIRNFTDFIINSSDSTFKQQISAKIREDNFADYFIFLNLLRAEDNQGKNLFLARYNETAPYFIAPWDLDGTWGYYWNGDQRNITDDILSNNLFNRLLSTTTTFKTQLATRWFSLRSTLLSTDSLYAAITANYTFLINNGVYERESRVWAGDYLSYGPEELAYIKTWTQKRATWLDSYFKNFSGNQPIVYDFKANVSGPDVVLNWDANSPAIASFAVEVSPDNSTWHALTTSNVLATDSAGCNYSFTDATEAANSLYYRLKVTDKTNSISYSSVLLVHPDFSGDPTAVSIFPNPVSTTLQVRGDVGKVNISSMLGASVYEADSASANTIDVQQFPAGMYLVRITQKDGQVSSHRIIINR